MSRLRSFSGRSGWWAAPAVGLLIAAVVGSSFSVSGVSGAANTTFVPVAPCRLIDTRPAYNVGPRNTPIGEDSPVTFTAWETGDFDSTCAIPTSATAISTNTTIVNPTEWSYLVLYPADAATPNASNLNYGPGQAPTPNAVTTPLSGAGQFEVYNRFGTVHVIVDVNGYYQHGKITGDDVQDGTLTGADISNGSINWWDIATGAIGAREVEDGGLGSAEIANESLRAWDLKDEAGFISARVDGIVYLPPNTGTPVDTNVIDVAITTPTSGYLMVTASGTFDFETSGLDQVSCSINKDVVYRTAHEFGAHDAGTGSVGWEGMIPFSYTVWFDVAAAAPYNLILVCAELSGDVEVWDPSITAVYFPTVYG